MEEGLIIILIFLNKLYSFIILSFFVNVVFRMIIIRKDVFCFDEYLGYHGNASRGYKNGAGGSGFGGNFG